VTLWRLIIVLVCTPESTYLERMPKLCQLRYLLIHTYTSKGVEKGAKEAIALPPKLIVFILEYTRKEYFKKQ